jgi:hypothetical protein
MSGVLRVTITPRPPWILLLLEVCTAAIFGVNASLATPSGNWYRILITLISLSALFAMLYQLCGEEVIEFDAQKLVIRREIFGWTFRSSEYPISECRELGCRAQKSEPGSRLECKVGWRTVRFGKYISPAEAIEILEALQANLPKVAQQTGATVDEQSITTLKLS